MPITDAIILAGGFGTRLRPLTARTPKPLLSVGGRPFLETLFARLAQAGVQRVVLSVHHQAQVLRRALPNLRHFGLGIVLRREPRPLGTGGAIRFAWPDPAKPCLVLNGDVLSDFDIRELQRQHRKTSATATLWAIEVEHTEAFGVLETDAERRVVKFVEKPRPGQSASRLINAGLYALEPEVLKCIMPGRPSSVEREVFPLLLQQGRSVRVCVAPSPPYWNDIGTPEAYLRANLDVLRKKLWKGRGLARSLWGKPDRNSNLLAASVRIAVDAKVSLSILGPSCRVDEGATVTGSILQHGCRISTGASLEGVLLAQGVHVGARCRIKAGAVLGPQSRLAQDTRL